jgi:hypothetical protein
MSSGLNGQAPPATASHSIHLIHSSVHTSCNEVSYLRNGWTYFLHAKCSYSISDLHSTTIKIWNPEITMEVKDIKQQR